MLPCFISSRKELALRSRRSTECAASAGRKTGDRRGEGGQTGKNVHGLKPRVGKEKGGNRGERDTGEDGGGG